MLAVDTLNCTLDFWSSVFGRFRRWKLAGMCRDTMPKRSGFVPLADVERQDFTSLWGRFCHGLPPCKFASRVSPTWLGSPSFGEGEGQVLG